MNNNLLQELKELIKGDVDTSAETINTFSHDASIFELKPQAVVFPKDNRDVEAIVSFVSKNKKKYPELFLTGRSAGTDMGGGSINTGITVAFGKYMNKFLGWDGDSASAQPGMFYRDFEKETLKKNLIFPSYPASREICAIGGIVNNNSGGEKSLRYGKTENYVKKIKIVLRDGKEYTIESLSEKKLKEKMKEKTLLGDIYKQLFELISKNDDELQKAKPKVSKNSAGYYLWNVWDKEKGVFNLNKLIVGAQGTLGLVTEAELELVPVHKHREMEVIFLHDMSHLGQIIDAVLPLKPESFESYDDNTLKLALRYFPEFIHQLGISGMIEAGLAFFPAFMEMMVGKLPKLILQVDFTGDDPDELKQKIATLREKLKPLHPVTRVSVDDQEKKYWLVRRESFNLLRNKIRNKHTAPFIDDFAINPKDIAEVLPQVTSILSKHKEFIFTVAGHVGDGNFHIIPLVDITNPKVRTLIPEIAKQVYEVIIKYHGTITAEHNDGLIRTPYLKQMYGEKIYKLFIETKKIFDPDNIFNPRKKIDLDDIHFGMQHIRENW